MVSAAQAAIVGVNARVLSKKMARGELERLAHGIYRLAGTPPSPHDNLRAAWIALAPGLTAAERIAAGPTKVVSHRSAALLHSLGDLDADLLEFTTSQRRQTRRDDIRIHRGVLNDHDWTLVDDLPTTTVLRTIHDLARSHTDRGHLASAVRDALLHHGLPVNQVETVLEPFARSYGISADSNHRLLDVLLNETGVPQTTLDIASRIHTPLLPPRS
jgi:predicted transcriptional regulator of viral defense system